ncbi:MAG: kelch repeat-containing protein [Planctomycetes bacterium]|jgi:hypothetical protein|nr:kelch repeat-containing protein [Planctomycetota bacterium]
MHILPQFLSLAATAAMAIAQTPPSWTQSLTGTQPGLRSLQGMAYDSARQRTVMFGGWNYPNGLFNSQTWEWGGTAWSQIQTASAPSARSHCMLAFDSVRNRIVLFGGYIAGSTFGDTWEYDGSNWLQRQPANSPSPRSGSTLAYDPVRQVTVLFGGYLSPSVEDNQTWEWNGSNWTRRFPAQQPSARSDMTVCYNPVTQRLLAFGGNAAGVDFRDLWAYNGTNWTFLSNAGPLGDSNAGLIWHPGRQRAMLCMGEGGQLCQWTWDGAVWHRECGINVPSSRRVFQAAYHAANQRVVVFGGDDGATTSNQTWLLDAGNPQTFSLNSVGAGCNSSLGPVVLQATTSPMIGTSFTTRMTGLPNGIALFLYGVTPLPGLAVGGLPAGCLAYVQPDVNVAVVHSGAASSTLPLPCDPALYGFSLRVQGAALDPLLPAALPLATSNALAVVVGS